MILQTSADVSQCVVYCVALIRACACADGPSNVTISGMMFDGTVDIGQHLTCTAAGFPLPSIEWLDPITRRWIIGSTLRVVELGPQSVACAASNTIRGFVHRAESNVTVVVTGASPLI